MSQANYKSTRLLVEAVNREMESVRKAAMGNMALGSLNELRDLVAQLVKKAERVALEDLTGMSESDPAEYVAAMMPFVAEYHRQLAPRDLLAPCLCRDLRLLACVVILVGEDKSTVKVAHDPARPDAALIVETLLASLDGGTKQVAADAATAKAQAVEAAAFIEGTLGQPFTGDPTQVEEVKRLPAESFRAGYQVSDEDALEPKLCGGCDCVAGSCDCEGCEGRTL